MFLLLNMNASDCCNAIKTQVIFNAVRRRFLPGGTLQVFGCEYAAGTLKLCPILDHDQLDFAMLF